MSPKEYLDRYTYLEIVSPLTGERMQAGVVSYGSGWISQRKLVGGTIGGGKVQEEYNQKFVPALRMAHHGNRNTPCGTRFFFADKPLGDISPMEEFYPETFTHAFLGKGSPDEITDTLRIAVAIGRIGEGVDLAGAPAYGGIDKYVAKFITLDCNGLVGNYYGINPETHIREYAAQSRRRMRVDQVQVGDAVVTHSDAAPFEHVAMIAEWDFPPSSAATGPVNVKLVEWGEQGGESKHYTGEVATRREIKRGPHSNYGIGFPSTSGASFRYIFARFPSPKSNGWW